MAGVYFGSNITFCAETQPDCNSDSSLAQQRQGSCCTFISGLLIFFQSVQVLFFSQYLVASLEGKQPLRGIFPKLSFYCENQGPIKTKSSLLYETHSVSKATLKLCSTCA